MKAIFNYILSFLKKGYTLLIFPIIFLVLRLFKKDSFHLEGEIKDHKKEITSLKKEQVKQEEKVISSEEEIKKDIVEVKDSLNKEIDKDHLKEILPGLK